MYDTGSVAPVDVALDSAGLVFSLSRFWKSELQQQMLARIMFEKTVRTRFHNKPKCNDDGPSNQSLCLLLPHTPGIMNSPSFSYSAMGRAPVIL
uniref:Uncharacterized protein n=1 Tax=Arion vulgaris TaxID=1028688 RepID=A0A0B7BZ50_9EUPU